MPDLELYVQTGCPFCAKVKDKLDELDLEYEEHTVSHIKFRRDEVEAISGQRGVPVLVDHEHGIEGMPESSEIVDYLEETYGASA